MTVRVAMWSGPRNISTAMMRAWESRGDTAVWDEPLYAYYLNETGIDHPGDAEVIAAGEPDWHKVVAQLEGEVPDGKAVYFQKHMTHHLLPDVARDWMSRVINCFLIRDPREVIASYSRTRPNVVSADVGISQQHEIFDFVTNKLGQPAVIVDSKDILMEPEGMLRALCAATGLQFTPRMLAWEPGLRASDGVWAKHWYHNVLESTGFAPYVPKAHNLPVHLEPLAAELQPYYEELHQRRLVSS